MIPYDIDPSLHASQRASERLDDGFEPPVEAPADPTRGREAEPGLPCDAAWQASSPF